MIALDTNLLLYDFHARAPEHRAAQAMMAQLRGRHWGVALAVLTEFYSVTTQSGLAAAMATTAEAAAYVEWLLAQGGQIWEPLPGFGERVVASAHEHGIIGRRIFDWQIGLTALDHGAIELWTHDRAFLAPPGLRLVDPLA
ncbi:MAG TPA: PIN domain-containing protein [Terriglobales bacterium]|nr:PIN domain-containing protein [Terriglobales bacterium]